MTCYLTAPAGRLLISLLLATAVFPCGVENRFIVDGEKFSLSLDRFGNIVLKGGKVQSSLGWAMQYRDPTSGKDVAISSLTPKAPGLRMLAAKPDKQNRLANKFWAPELEGESVAFFLFQQQVVNVPVPHRNLIADPSDVIRTSCGKEVTGIKFIETFRNTGKTRLEMLAGLVQTCLPGACNDLSTSLRAAKALQEMLRASAVQCGEKSTRSDCLRMESKGSSGKSSTSSAKSVAGMMAMIAHNVGLDPGQTATIEINIPVKINITPK